MTNLRCLLLLLLPVILWGQMPAEFATPPGDVRPRVFWWWNDNATTKAALTHDLEEMHAKGIKGALLWYNPQVLIPVLGTRHDPLPQGPEFLSREWRELVTHAIKEADRLGIEITLNLSMGSNCGGPWMPPELSAQKLVWSERSVTGPVSFDEDLPFPDKVPRGADGKPVYYRDVAVVAARQREDGSYEAWSDHSKEMTPEGRLRWSVPAGRHVILRFGDSMSEAIVGGKAAAHSGGRYVDPMSKEAVRFHFRAMVEEMLKDAGAYAGKSWKYVHCDSWEISPANWTPNLMAEFRRRRGYDATLYLAGLAKPEALPAGIRQRFWEDYQKTMSDCIVEYHGQQLVDLCRQHKLGFSSEAGGPHVFPIDALRAHARTDLTMGEFWMRSGHSYHDTQRLVKQPASAAHIYGRRFAAAEAFTSIGPHWEEDPWAMKPVCDQAFIEGANLFYLHTFTHSPPVAGKPGWEYFAGTHFNPNITWWKEARVWTDYIARGQYMLSQGLFVADVLYYYGDQVPNFVRWKRTAPGLAPGYDYDVANAEVILTRLTVKNGRLVLPDGMSYRVLVMPDREDVSLPVLRKIGELIAAGATVVGRKPVRSSGLEGYPERDRDVAALANKIWGERGRESLQDALHAASVTPDFEYRAPHTDASIEYIHRRTATADIYFVANQQEREEEFDASFRVEGKQAEFWELDTGRVRRAPTSSSSHGRTVVPMKLAPYGSVFVVFRGTPSRQPVMEVGPLTELAQVEGSWRLSFEPGRGAPASAVFDKLISWTEHTDAGIRYFSGTATYRTTFLAAATWKRAERVLSLDLGQVKNIAHVWVNGVDVGVAWKPPYRVEVTGALHTGANEIRIEVTNLWPNRLIGDEFLPPAKRITSTNIHKFTKDSPLLPSGLLGPVRILAGERRAAVFVK
jgi:hypothetical protein